MFKAVLTGFTTSKVVYYVADLSNAACFPYRLEHFLVKFGDGVKNGHLTVNKHTLSMSMVL